VYKGPTLFDRMGSGRFAAGIGEEDQDHVYSFATQV